MRLHITALWLAQAASFSAAPALAQTTSPFPPPEEKLGIYVANSGTGLDTGCTYRGGGPLLIKIPLPKVVNDKQLKSDGTLVDAAKLVSNGVLSAQATIRFPVFDIDDKAQVSGIAPEVDRVTFNGKFKKTLEGFNNTWTDDSIIVPIEELKFGQDNELRIDIDTANSGEQWCMAVDWVSIEFEATPPYVLAHGITANRDDWDEGEAPGVLAALEDRGVLIERWSLGVERKGNGRVADNAIELDAHIVDYLKPLKANKVHVIAHSKGGLDTQGLQALGPEYEIVSLSTLSTPHRGSVAADLSIIQKAKANDLVARGDDPDGLAAAYIDGWTFGKGPQLPGLCDLTTYAAKAAISTGQRGNIPATYTFGANADLNHDDQLTANETAPYNSLAHDALERAWRVLRTFQEAPMTLTTVPGHIWGTRTVLTYTTALNPEPQANDIVVAESSANPGYGTPLGNSAANHRTVRSVGNINKALDTTIPLK
ncbi:triacylglycerol lipase [Massilia sp. BJB1822]|uniref:esterase/lipase family protein n=1 Tax=Massilia sp. BJB1822 TaxID=2744470 RepID=UPI001594E0CA|nr:alpha/beta hydrolase [Massilia sp. BJB1822]NVD97576.1 alpha/beta hydrolase [Massilia sp. BJB1822]